MAKKYLGSASEGTAFNASEKASVVVTTEA